MNIDTGTDQLLCEVRNGVAVITLNRAGGAQRPFG